MAYCTKCGNYYSQGSRFCSKCGAMTGEIGTDVVADLRESAMEEMRSLYNYFSKDFSKRKKINNNSALMKQNKSKAYDLTNQNEKLEDKIRKNYRVVRYTVSGIILSVLGGVLDIGAIAYILSFGRIEAVKGVIKELPRTLLAMGLLSYEFIELLIGDKRLICVEDWTAVIIGLIGIILVIIGCLNLLAIPIRKVRATVCESVLRKQIEENSVSIKTLVNQYNELALENERLETEIKDHYSKYKNCPIGIEYTRETYLMKLYGYLKSGEAHSIKEAIQRYLLHKHEEKVEEDMRQARENTESALWAAAEAASEAREARYAADSAASSASAAEIAARYRY